MTYLLEIWDGFQQFALKRYLSYSDTDVAVVTVLFPFLAILWSSFRYVGQPPVFASND